MSASTARPHAILGPAGREIALMASAVLAIVIPFANGVLAGRPGPMASLDLRYVLVVGGAALGLLACVAWRASTAVALAGRVRIGIVLAMLLPVLLALQNPREPLWVSVLTLEVLLGAPLIVLGAAWRLARPLGAHRNARIAGAVITILALVGPWTTLVWGLTQTQLAIAPVRLAHQRPVRQAGEEEVELRAADGLLVRGTYTPGRRGAPAVVLLHGISDGRTRMAGWAALVAEQRGYHALRIDWRAHGRSEGSVVTFADRELLDLDAAFDWLAAREDVDHEKTLIVAGSMGAGVALAAIPRLAPRGLRGIVAFAPPSDYAPIVSCRIEPLGVIAPLARFVMNGVAHGLGHVSPLELAPGRGLELAAPVPVLLFHGDDDHTVPLASSQELAARVPTVELHVLPGVGHDELTAAVLDDDSSRVRALQFLRFPRARTQPAADER